MATAKAKAKIRRGRPVAKDKAIKTLGYRVSQAYLDWITRAADANRSTVSVLIDQAVASYAPRIGVTELPPDRTA